MVRRCVSNRPPALNDQFAATRTEFRVSNTPTTPLCVTNSLCELMCLSTLPNSYMYVLVRYTSDKMAVRTICNGGHADGHPSRTAIVHRVRRRA